MSSGLCQRQPRMRIVISEFISLDGVVQAPGGKDEDTDGGFQHGGWSMPYFDEEVMGGFFDESVKSTEALLFGRRTWQTMAAAWPDRAGDPFADHMNAVKKYVVSGTLTEADLHWNNTTLIGPDDVAGSIRAIKSEGSGDLHVMGSPTLVRSLMSDDLVDEFRLMIEPIVLGGG